MLAYFKMVSKLRPYP